MRLHLYVNIKYQLNTIKYSVYDLRLRNDLYCVEWGVKLYSLTHSVYDLQSSDMRHKP